MVVKNIFRYTPVKSFEKVISLPTAGRGCDCGTFLKFIYAIGGIFGKGGSDG
jgi:hypothetical protein